MTRSIYLIVKKEAEAVAFQGDWDRQVRTAEAILKRHEEGFGTVLLADEVGMGKTYVALAVIAHHVFQSTANDRKVLLVVPPNNTLSRKWHQEIRSFNNKYLHESLGIGEPKKVQKQLQPLVVTDYWELIQNLNTFENRAPMKVYEATVQYFALALSIWNEKSRKPGTWRRVWSSTGDLDADSPSYLNFCASYSQRAIEAFMDERMVSNRTEIRTLIAALDNGQPAEETLKKIFKQFAREQDRYEANVFVLGMGTLRRSRSDAKPSRLLNTYIVCCALKNRWKGKKMAVFKRLVKDDLCFLPAQKMVKGRKAHFEWFTDLASVDLWGMNSAVRTVLDHAVDLDEFCDLLVSGTREAVLTQLKVLQDEVINEKLMHSGIGLVVVDEVHNWKNGSNGADQFKRRYAPRIKKKLIMSATPFQLAQQELGEIFKHVCSADDRSEEVVDGLLGEGGLAQSCIASSSHFFQAWNNLTDSDNQILGEEWTTTTDSETAINRLSVRPGTSETLNVFISCLQSYGVFLRQLQERLGQVVIRHTKLREKRHFHAGEEYTVNGNPDYTRQRLSLPAVPGYTDDSDTLLNLMAMRIHQLIRSDLAPGQYQANAHLIGGMTSSRSAFSESNQKLLKITALSARTKEYLRFFESALKALPHPKVRVTVERAFNNFKEGRKTLIFCDRLGTQAEILCALNAKINKELFPRGGLEQASKDREAILKEHACVELYWSRSWLSMLALRDRDAVRTRWLTGADTLIQRVRTKVSVLGGHANERQVMKLLDLAMVAQANTDDYDYLGVIGQLFDGNDEALRRYLRMKEDIADDEIEDTLRESDMNMEEFTTDRLLSILEGSSIWHANADASLLHAELGQLMASELSQLSAETTTEILEVIQGVMLDVGQGLRKVLLRLDLLQTVERLGNESLAEAAVRVLASPVNESPALAWQRTREFICALIGADGTIRRKDNTTTRRQGLWKGVFLRDERIASEINGNVNMDRRANLCAAFNSRLLPDILVCTAIGSEGIDLHRYCAEVIHHDLPWNPARLEQRTGRVDRVGSLAERCYQHDYFRLNIGIPYFAQNYESFQYEQLRKRSQQFEILLGQPDFTLEIEEEVARDYEGILIDEFREVSTENEPVPAFSIAMRCLPTGILEHLTIDLSCLD